MQACYSSLHLQKQKGLRESWLQSRQLSNDHLHDLQFQSIVCPSH